MNNPQAIIKVGFCVSYDWKLLENSLPRVYNESDLICLGIDSQRKSWSGNKFDFDDEAFYRFVEKIDSNKKITIYEDCFSLPELDARQNCNRHRTMIAEKMGRGGWHIQVDCDEYFLNFRAFTEFLKKIHRNPTGSEKAVNVNVCLIPLLKKTKEGYLFVDFRDTLPENAPFATNKPEYLRARNNGHFNVLSPFFAIHETWARSESELWYKINNWGHSAEELTEKEVRLSYYNLWKSLDANNFQYIRDFHPASPKVWPALGFVPAGSIDEVIEKLKAPSLPFGRLELAFRNSRNFARLKAIAQKVLG